MTLEEMDAALAEKATQVQGIMSARGIAAEGAGAGMTSGDMSGPLGRQEQAPPSVPQSSAPTIDPEAQALDQKYQEVTQHLKSQGHADPEEDIGAVTNVVRAANSKIANILAYPVEVVNQALEQGGANFMKRHDAEQAVRTVFTKLGIRSDAREGLSKQLGETIPESAVALGAIFAAAPAMAAQAGTNVGAWLVRQLGEQALKHPWVTSVLQVGGDVGGRVAGDAAEGSSVSASTAGGVGGAIAGAKAGSTMGSGIIGKGIGGGLGAIVGGVMGSTAAGAIAPEGEVPMQGVAQVAGGLAGSLTAARGANVIGGIGNKLLTPVRNVAESLGASADNTAGKVLGMKAGVPLEPEPLFQRQFDTTRSTNFADEQVKGATLQMEDAVDRAISGIRTDTVGRAARPNTAVEAQAKVYQGLQDAYGTARKIESDFWEHTPLKTKVPGGQLVQDVGEFRDRLTAQASPTQVPSQQIDEVFGLYKTQQGDGGRFKPSLPTVQRLRAINTDLSESIAKEPQSFALNRNRVQLQNIINDAIEQALPDNVPIQQARAVSTKVHDLFTRGPIADVLAKGRDRGNIIPPGQSMEYLTKQFEGIDSVLNVSRDLGRIPRRFGQPDAYPVATGSMQARPEMKALQDSAENAIRTMVKEEAQQMGPQAGVKYIAKLEPQIAPLARVTTELRQTADYLSAHLDNQKVIQTSALARFAQADSEKAIQSIWSSRDPVKVAKELMQSFPKEPEALEGLRQGFLKRLFTATKGDPIRVREALETPRFRGALDTILSPEQLGRLDKLTKISNQLIAGDENSATRAFIARRFTILGKIVGAFVGRKLETGTMQAPSLISKAFGGAMEKFFHALPPETLFANAVQDPVWERILLMREPTSTKEMKQTVTMMRRMIAISEGPRNHNKRDETDGKE